MRRPVYDPRIPFGARDSKINPNVFFFTDRRFPGSELLGNFKPARLSVGHQGSELLSGFRKLLCSFVNAMLRNILHFRIDAFPVAVERLRNPALRARPVAVCPRHSPRALVFSASREAREEGVAEGLPVTVALKRCPRLMLQQQDEALYGRASEAVARVLRRYAPLVESGTRGRFYADLSGTGRLFVGARDAAFRILRDVSDSVRFEGTVGLASNKLVSGVAARVIRYCGDLCEVPAGSEAPFLAPLRVRLLPAVRKAEAPLLAEFNIRFVEQLAGIPLPQLVRVFGRFGCVLHRQALGIDESPVHSPEVKPFVLEEETLAGDTNDDAVLLSVLRLLADRACSRMRAKNVFARTAWLHIRYSNGMDTVRRLRLNLTASVSERIQMSSSLQIEDTPPLAAVSFNLTASAFPLACRGARERTQKPLSLPIEDSRSSLPGSVNCPALGRILFRLIAPAFLRANASRQRVRHLSLTLTDLTPSGMQLGLFDGIPALAREEKLACAVESLRGKYGFSSVGFGLQWDLPGNPF